MNQPQKIATMAINENGERVVKISFPYDLDMLNNIRTLPGRKWHPNPKCWSAPIYEKSLQKIEQESHSMSILKFMEALQLNGNFLS